MTLTQLLLAWIFSAALCEYTTDVWNLVGEADFRSVVLQWKYPVSDSSWPSSLSGFLVTYCEDQAWGKYRCKKKVLDELSKNEIKELNGEGIFEATLDGLRMATNYTVEVRPFLGGPDSTLNRGRSIGSLIKIQTKGFSARAIRCLANSSLVEIETGPFFGGKISVEGTTNKKCSTQGDYADPKTSYFLKIDHRLCGSQVFNSSVKTFIIVQENLPILTHSTRRFMVVCTYVPETFTVRAGVNLPYDDNGDSANDLIPIDEDVVEVDPSELFDSTNNLFSSRASKQVGRALRFSTENEKEPQRWSHLVLMVIMVIAATVGMVIAVWQFVHRMRKSNRSGFMSPQLEPSAIAIDENLEAVVRDFGECLEESQAGSIAQAPPVALDELDVLDIEDNHSYVTIDRRTPDIMSLEAEVFPRLPTVTETPIYTNEDISKMMILEGLSRNFQTDCFLTGVNPLAITDYDQSLQLLSINSADIPLPEPSLCEQRGVLVPELDFNNTIILDSDFEFGEDHSIFSAVNPFVSSFPLAVVDSGLPKDSDSLVPHVNITRRSLRSSFHTPSLPTFESSVIYENLQEFSSKFQSDDESEPKYDSDEQESSLPVFSEPRSLPTPINTNWQLRDEDGQIFPSLSV